MHTMDWDGLQVFLAVARAGRISGAARRLGVEHTTVSRRLGALEDELGVPLFHRTAGGYLLTPHGHGALPSAEAMERAALAVGARAREDSDRVAGRVRLALPPEVASHWFVPHLAAFRRLHPQIDLQLLVGTRQRNLSRGEAELALQSQPRQGGLVAVRLGRASLRLYASRAFAGGRRFRISQVEHVRGLPLLVFIPALQMLQNAKWFQPVLAGARIALESNSTHVLLAAVRAGAGIAVLPRLVARGDESLVEVSDDVAVTEVWLVTHPEFRRDPKVRATTDFLKRISSGANGIC
jgi:DNA-binding transcriptional LysR family regulator